MQYYLRMLLTYSIYIDYFPANFATFKKSDHIGQKQNILTVQDFFLDRCIISATRLYSSNRFR